MGISASVVAVTMFGKASLLTSSQTLRERKVFENLKLLKVTTSVYLHLK
jgi:hypothetical protein